MNDNLNMVGAYGQWLSKKVLGDGPARLSFRSGQWDDIDHWRTIAREKLIDCMSPVDLGIKPNVTVESSYIYDELYIEDLSWQLPNGPRTKAVFLKPAKAKGKLPAVLGLHDHAGNKFLGWRKITKTNKTPWVIQKEHQSIYYEGVAWANELARQGYAVLIHDTFPFASRRVHVEDLPEIIRNDGVDPEPTDLDGVNSYNKFAGIHENIMEKSLLCAGTTWPGVYVIEDQKALDILCSREDVDSDRVGCAGLSGGGMRTVYLNAIDSRIKCAVAAGFMTTWRDFLLNKCFIHTWMAYIPLISKYLDFPEIFALNAKSNCLVLNCNEDKLFTKSEMVRANNILREIYDSEGLSHKYKCSFYPGGHKFDIDMQKEAFAWLNNTLKNL